MRKIISIVLLMVAYAGSAFSQTGFSFVDDDMQWSYRVEMNAEFAWISGIDQTIVTVIYQYDGDTTINDKIYNVMKKSEDSCVTWQRVGFVREDAEKNVYFIRDGENVESLFYEFAMSIEDCVAKNVEVDSIEVQGNKVARYKQYEDLQTDESYNDIDLYTDVIIAEIGGIYQLKMDSLGFGRPYMSGANYYPNLLCVQKGNVLLWQNPKYDKCYYNATIKLPIEEISKQNFLISPNPVHSTLYLTLPQGEHTITIYNAAGTPVLKQQTAEPQAQIVVNGLAAGVYFVQVDGGEMLKFVKE